MKASSIRWRHWLADYHSLVHSSGGSRQLSLLPPIGGTLSYAIAIEIRVVATLGLTRLEDQPVGSVGAASGQQRRRSIKPIKLSHSIVVGPVAQPQCVADPIPLGGLMNSEQFTLGVLIDIAQKSSPLGGDKRGRELGVLSHLRGFSSADALHNRHQGQHRADTCQNALHGQSGTPRRLRDPISFSILPPGRCERTAGHPTRHLQEHASPTFHAKVRHKRGHGTAPDRRRLCSWGVDRDALEPNGCRPPRSWQSRVPKPHRHVPVWARGTIAVTRRIIGG